MAWIRTYPVPTDSNLKTCSQCGEESAALIEFTYGGIVPLPGATVVTQSSQARYPVCAVHLAEFKRRWITRIVIQGAGLALGGALAGLSWKVFRGNTANVVMYVGLAILGVVTLSFFLLPSLAPKVNLGGRRMKRR